jgi:hypothetical protein
VPLEVVDHRVDDDLWLLRGVGAVEVDQRNPARERALEDREVLADHVEIRKQSFHGGLLSRCSGWWAQAVAVVRYLS